MSKLIDLTGKVYGRLTVISLDSIRNNKAHWDCSCVCGNKCIVSSGNLKNQKQRSCGCLLRETSRMINYKHGDSGSKEHAAWKAIKARCYSLTRKEYHNYGGRGITVCDRWLESYSNFLSDMGRAPSPKHSIDRKDNDGNYEPSNCRWATAKEQACNRRKKIHWT